MIFFSWQSNRLDLYGVQKCKAKKRKRKKKHAQIPRIAKWVIALGSEEEKQCVQWSHKAAELQTHRVCKTVAIIVEVFPEQP